MEQIYDRNSKKNIIRCFFLQSIKYHLKIEKIYEYKHSNINSTKIYIFFFFSKRKPNNLFLYTKTRLNFVPPLADYFITYNLTIIRQSWTQMQYKKCKNMGTIDAGFLLISLDFLQIQVKNVLGLNQVVEKNVSATNPSQCSMFIISSLDSSYSKEFCVQQLQQKKYSCPFNIIFYS